MGVVYLLAYVAGGVLVALAGMNVLRASLAGEELSLQVQLVLVGMGLIVAAGWLHALVARRRAPEGEHPSAGSAAEGRWIWLALAVWALPIVIGWVQFELFVNPVHMTPWLTAIAGPVFVWLVVRRVLATRSMRGPGSAVAAALIGVPMGLAGAVLPISHFAAHLTDVTMTLRSPYSAWSDVKTVTVEHDDVDIGPAPSTKLDETLRMLDALANAVPVEGTPPPGAEIGGAADLERAVDEATAADARRTAEARAEHLRALEEERERRRRGGRLFSR